MDKIAAKPMSPYVEKTLDEDLFRLLYKQNKNDLVSFAKRYVHAEQIAEDIVHDVFTKLWDRRQDLDHILSFRPYLFRMVKNKTLDDLKKINRIDLMPQEMVSEFKYFDVGIQNLAIEKEYFDFLKGELEKLPETAKNVFVMCREMGKSYEEVSEELKISKHTVKHHMVAVVKKLKLQVLNKLNISNGLGHAVILLVAKYLPFIVNKSL